MAEGILGLGSKGSQGLSSELIEKLKTAEAKGKVDPFDKKLETWEKEVEIITNIENKVSELLASIKKFDLYSSGANSFEQVTANTTGTSAMFNALDVAELKPGSHKVDIKQLAQRDVYQTSIFNGTDELVGNGTLNVTIAGNTSTFTTDGKSYAELVKEIDYVDGLTASVEQVGDSDYRLVIKSTNSGESNKLTISTSGSIDLGFSGGTTKVLKNQDYNPSSNPAYITGIVINGDTIDNFPDGKYTNYDDLVQEINNYKEDGVQQYEASTSFDEITHEFTFTIKALDGSSVSVEEIGDGDGASFVNESHVVQAQNMKANVNGVEYDISENNIIIEGNLTISAVDVGISTITMDRDNSTIIPSLEEFVTKYNELNTLINDELYSADSPLEDTSSLKMMMSNIKDQLFGSYGVDEDISIFNHGFDIDKTGNISIDSSVLSASITNNFENMKALFIGSAEKPGLGTVITEYVDALDGYEGLLTQYGKDMADRKIGYEEEKTNAQEALDTKYSQMALQFAAYTAVISQMEAAFGGMKMMMEQSTAS